MTILLQIMEWIHTYQREVFAGAFFGVQAVSYTHLTLPTNSLV